MLQPKSLQRPPHQFTLAIAASLFLFLLSACGVPATTAPSAPPAPSMVSTVESATESLPGESSATIYPLTIQNGDHTLVFEKAPERAVSLNLHTTELILALGLADKMVGTAYANATILPEYEADYNQIPILAEQYPSLETLVAAEPDFTYGRSSAYGADGVGSVEELATLGINAYTVEGTLVNAATLDVVWTDIRNLGEIFDIQERAEALIASMQAEIVQTQAQIGEIDEPVSVLVYDAGTDDLFTAGQSLQTNLITLAGGKNVFEDMQDNWVTVSWEEAVARNPEVIVINDYGAVPLEEKIAFLQNNAALSSIAAIQNNRLVAIPLPSVFEGVRNPDAVRTLAEGFYPERFVEAATTESTASSPSAFPVTIECCGIETTYDAPPQRAVTMNQAATEIMLALGLETQMVGTAYLDDAVLPQYPAAYETVPVLAEEYPSQEILFGVEPDFIYGSYRSAFDDEAAGPRAELAELEIHSYLSVASCEEAALRPEKVTFATLFDEITDIGRIFGVQDRAEALVDEMQATLDEVAATIGTETEPLRIFWYDSEAEAPSVGACCGAPAMLMEAVGVENVFADAPGSWVNITWEEVVARAPEVVVLADAEWSTAQEKQELLLNDPTYSSIPAVQNERFVVIPFGATTLGVRNVEGVTILARGLYPEKFE